MRFCTLTLGCKVNQFETQAMEALLTQRGHVLVKPGDGCDVCIINTCAVTNESAGKSRRAIRGMAALEKGALIAACGCYAQLEAATAASLGADLVRGVGDRRGFVMEVERLVAEGSARAESEPSVTEPPAAFEILPAGAASGRTRALLKVQDGCDNFCAYCIVPYIRGRVRSLPLRAAYDQAKSLQERGYKEIVITGIEISSYGKDLPEKAGIADAVREISNAAPEARLRLGSLHPDAVSDGFCEKMRGIPNLCAHFHLSLQSGCDETLRRMGRKYSTAEAGLAITRLRGAFPDCAITADIITGFPGETDEEFSATMEFLEKETFSRLHVFPYSERPGTAAADMPDKVKVNVRQERAKIAAQVGKRMQAGFITSQIGKTHDVLLERRRGGTWTGYTGNYIEVAIPGGGEKNEVRKVRITGASNGIVIGEDA